MQDRCLCPEAEWLQQEHVSSEVPRPLSKPTQSIRDVKELDERKIRIYRHRKRESANCRNRRNSSKRPEDSSLVSQPLESDEESDGNGVIICFHTIHRIVN